jgi:hypothetical protein
MEINGELMNPPWIEMPDIPQGIGWRMGPGQEYMMKFCPWFAALSELEKKQYALDFPEDIQWQGFYKTFI